MIRTQIQLTDEQAQAPKSLSTKTGLSIAEFVRRGLVPLLLGGLAEHDGRDARRLLCVGSTRERLISLSITTNIKQMPDAWRCHRHLCVFCGT